MKLLLRAYPRSWRERYGEELSALLEAEPLTWRVLANVVRCGLGERLRGSGPPSLQVLWAWSVFVIGGMAFQKTAEHWQVAVPVGDRAVPTAAFDIVQAAAAIGSIAILVAVAVALPAFVRDLRSGGWSAMRRPILIASATSAVAAVALVALALAPDVVTGSFFVAFAVAALLAWTHAAALAARRLPRLRAHDHLARIVTAAMLVMTVGAAVWVVSVTAHAPSFVGDAHLAAIATFMLAGTALAAVGSARSLRA